MNTIRILPLVLTLGLTLLPATDALSQLPGGGSQMGVNAAMLKLFGDIKGFTAQADVKVTEKGGQGTTTMGMDFAFLDGKVRIDLDMTNLKTTQVPADTLASLRQMGLDKIVSVVRPDKKNMLFIYPTARAYAEAPMSPSDVADAGRNYVTEKSQIGKETLQGRACVKTKVVVKSEGKPHLDALVWYAKDLQNFPLRIEMDQPEMTIVFDYRNVVISNPEPKRFDSPTGYTRYNSAEQLMQAVMLKALGGGK